MKSIRKIAAVALSLIVAVNVSVFSVSAAETKQMPVKGHSSPAVVDGTIHFESYTVKESFENSLVYENGYQLWVGNQSTGWVEYDTEYENYYLPDVPSGEDLTFKLCLPEGEDDATVPTLYIDGEAFEFDDDLTITTSLTFYADNPGAYVWLGSEETDDPDMPSSEAWLDLMSADMSYDKDFCIYSAENPEYEETVEGIYYDEETNTLTLSNFTDTDLFILGNEMGSGFSIELIGENSLAGINLFSWNHCTALSIYGDGSLVLNENKNFDDIPMYVHGNYDLAYISIESGTDVKVFSSDEEVPPLVVDKTTLDESIFIDDITSVCTEVASEPVFADGYMSSLNTFYPATLKDSCIIDDYAVGIYYDEIWEEDVEAVFKLETLETKNGGYLIARELNADVDDFDVNYHKKIEAFMVKDYSYDSLPTYIDESNNIYAISNYMVEADDTLEENYDLYIPVEMDEDTVFIPFMLDLEEIPETLTPICEDTDAYYSYYTNSEFDNLNVQYCDHDFIGGECIHCGITGCYVGDANLDGQVTINDATYIQKCLADFEEFDPMGEWAADVNDDGVVTITDATLIQ